METKLVRLMSFESAHEADTARVALEHEGIKACLDGVSVVHALGYLGAALGGVGLMVASDDAHRAAQILAELAREAELVKSPWYCGACREDVEPSFDVCWSCGKDRGEVEIVRPFGSASPVDAALAGDEDSDATLVNVSPHSEANPYRSPRVGDERSANLRDDEELGEDPEIEAMLSRAWRASILGIVFFPLILHLYSMWLLLRASISGRQFSPEGSRRFYQAFGVNILAGGVWGVVGWLWLGI